MLKAISMGIGNGAPSTACFCLSLCVCSAKLEEKGERSGSVVECLTRDRGAADASLTGVTKLCP